MDKVIGLSRNITLEWMNYAASLKLSGKTVQEASSCLDSKIAETISSTVNGSKIRSILLSLWFRPDDWFLQSCAACLDRVSEMERIPLHWALFIKRFSMFYDIASVMGDLFSYREEITLTQIRNRIHEKCGARTTYDVALPKNVKMFKELNALSAGSTQGSYTKCSITLDDPFVVRLLVAALIEQSDREYMTWENVVQHPALFPFHIDHISQADMAACDFLVLERMGDDVVLRCKSR